MSARTLIDNAAEPIAKCGESVRLTKLWVCPMNGAGRIPNRAVLLRRYRERVDNPRMTIFGKVIAHGAQQGNLPLIDIKPDHPIRVSDYFSQESIQLFNLVNVDPHIYYDDAAHTAYWVEPGMARARVGNLLSDE